MRDRTAAPAKDKENHYQHRKMVTEKTGGKTEQGDRERKKERERELEHVVIKLTRSRTNIALGV